MSGGCATSVSSGGATGALLSGPVTESNGLRERIGSALVACGRRRGRRGGDARRERRRGELRLVGAQACADDVHDPLRVEERRDGDEHDDHRPEVALEELVDGHGGRGEVRR